MGALLQMMAARGAAGISAPGTVTLGTPTGAGIPWTMPSLPAGAGSLILQASLDNVTFYDRETGLAGGATGTFAVAVVDGGSPAGAQGTVHYFRAKNTTGGATGSSTNATTVALPAAPAAPGNVSHNVGSSEVTYDMPAAPARTTASGGAVSYNKEGEGWNSTGQNNPWAQGANVWTYGFAAPEVSFQLRIDGVANIYGTGPDGAAAEVPLS